MRDFLGKNIERILIDTGKIYIKKY